MEDTNSEFQYKFVDILREHTVIFNKSQVPELRRRKADAMEEIRKKCEKELGVVLTEAQFQKKIQNMKTRLKTKLNAQRMGNTIARLKGWERKLLEIMKCDIPSNIRMPGAKVAGFDSVMSTTNSGGSIAASITASSFNIPDSEPSATLSTNASTSSTTATSRIHESVTCASSASGIALPAADDNNDDNDEDEDYVEDIDDEDGRGAAVSETEVTTTGPARIIIDPRPKKKKLQEFETDVTLGLSLSELQRYVLLKQLRVLEMQEQKLLKRQRVLDLEEEKLLWKKKKREYENGDDTGQTFEKVKVKEEQLWT